MQERPLGPWLGAGLAIVASIGLAGCTSFFGVQTDQQVITGTAQTPPLDEIKDDLALAKEKYREGAFGLAQKHFRLAVEKHPTRPEAWLGLAASYDKLRRFDLADRAYARAYKLTGPTPEFLNNRGYSYLLRGNFRRANADLSEAAIKAPDDERIQSNLEVLAQRRSGN